MPGGALAGGSDSRQIARLAYSYWEARGGCGGSAEDDWYRAEQELLGRSAGKERSGPSRPAASKVALAGGAAGPSR